MDVIAACGMRAAALTANRSVRELEEQARRFRPELAVLMEEDAAADLKVRLADTGVRVAAGMEGLLEAASLPGADTVLTAVVGMVGLRPTLAAIREGKRIALANKETLVWAGRCEKAEPDLLWGARLWAYGLRAERNDKGGRLTASKLVHGGQDHCGFRHSNE